MVEAAPEVEVKVAAPAPEIVAAPAPIAEVVDRPARGSRRTRPEAPRPAARDARPAPARREVRGERDDDRAVKGFGSDVPAFLQRVPPRFSKATEE